MISTTLRFIIHIRNYEFKCFSLKKKINTQILKAKTTIFVNYFYLIKHNHTMIEMMKNDYISPEIHTVDICYEGMLCMSGLEDLEENDGIW